MNKTKIIATVGPATASKEMIRHLILNGVDTFRICRIKYLCCYYDRYKRTYR